MMERRRFMTATAAAVATIAGCTGGGGGGGSATVKETSEVSQTGKQFKPRNIKIDVGTTVTWTNDDGFAHTVTSASDNWSKDTRLASGEKTTHTFEESGVYDVYCTIHGSSDLSGMSMKIAVGDATIESPLGGGGDDDGGGVY